MEEWRYRSTHSQLVLWMEVSRQLHATTTLTPEKGVWVWADPRAGLDVAAKKKIPSPPGNQTPRNNSLYYVISFY